MLDKTLIPMVESIEYRLFRRYSATERMAALKDMTATLPTDQAKALLDNVAPTCSTPE